MNGYVTRILSVALLLAAATVSRAQQQAVPDSGFVAPKTRKAKLDTSSLEKPQTVEVTGVIKQAAETKKVYQLVNPLAPEKYGNGQDDVSWDPDNPDKPKGIILFGCQW